MYAWNNRTQIRGTMSEILKTKDYSIFKIHPNNSEVEEAHVKKLMASLSKKNLLEYKPILVNEKMEIVDGLHRFHAAKRLGIEVCFQIQEGAEPDDIVIYNANMRKWKLQRFVSHHASKGNPVFQKIKDFCESRGMSIMEFAKASSRDGYNALKSMKDGTIKMPSQEIFDKIDRANEKVECFLNKLKSYQIESTEVIKSTNFRKAVLLFAMHSKVDFDVLLKKLAYKAEIIRPCTSIIAYLGILRDMYNWKNSLPVDMIGRR
jgi:hypothetical protein